MRKIIIVDDDNGIQDVMRLLFTRMNYEVTIYPNSESVMELDFEPPDAFLLDKQLPGVNGLALCRFLKSHPLTRHVPVIILSATNHLDDQAIAAGADDYMEKPFRIKDLIEKVDRLTTHVI